MCAEWTPGELLTIYDRELYRDHLGRSVLADREGPGWFEVLEGAPECEVDGMSVELGEGFFAHDFVARGEGMVAVWDRARRSFSEVESQPFEDLGWRRSGVGWCPVRGGGEGVRATSARVVVASFSPLNPPEEVGWRVQNVSEPERVAAGLMGIAHLNEARWSVNLPPGVHGIEITRWYDAWHGRQRARVLANGIPVGIWYEPQARRDVRVQESLFGFPWPHAGPIELALDPPAGAPLWSVIALTVYAILPATS